MRDFWQDVRHGLRSLARSLAFTIVVVLTLALGLGANAAIFTIFEAVILRPLSYSQPSQLVSLYGSNPRQGEFRNRVSDADFRDWKAQNKSFAGMTEFYDENWTLSGTQDPERLSCFRAYGNFFQVLGIRAVAGRMFSEADDTPTAPDVVVISRGLWQRRFGGRLDLLGSVITLNGHPFTVIGVMPEGTDLLAGVDVVSPLGGPLEASRKARLMFVVGRLRPAVSIEVAQSEMTALAKGLEASYPDTNTDWSVAIVPLREDVTGSLRRPLLVLLGAVGLVLLIACANATNLQLVRGSWREHEMATRAALGAGRARLVRQSIVESGLLAAGGGLLGLALAYLAVGYADRLAGPEFLGDARVHLDYKVLGYMAILCALSTIVAGLVPALRASRASATSLLAGASRGTARSDARSGSILIVSEIAMCLVLLLGAGLLLRSFSQMVRVEPGFQPQRLLTFQVTLAGQRYAQIPSQKEYIREVVQRLKTYPGVAGVASISQPPFCASCPKVEAYFSIEAKPTVAGEEPTLNYRTVSPNYFAVAGVPILRGRGFDEEDTATAPGAVVINEAASKHFWPGEDPLGKRIRWEKMGGSDQWYTVVGVAGDVKGFGLDSEERPAAYVSYTQRFFPWFRWTSFMIRTASEPIPFTSGIRHEIYQVDDTVPIYGVTTIDSLMESSTRPHRVLLVLFGVFAAIALVLAAVGIYGVISFWVARRTHEIGIRMALGAQRTTIVRMVLAKGVQLTLLGLSLGLVLGLALARFIEHLLFKLEPTDPFTLASVAVLLSGVALAACFLPAWRATKVDPLVALRYE
jgi:putative ABC transport system permease protein